MKRPDIIWSELASAAKKIQITERTHPGLTEDERTDTQYHIDRLATQWENVAGVHSDILAGKA